jgi:tetratricopeptide (TPR) repeat protein
MLRARVALRIGDTQWALADAARAVEVAAEHPKQLTGCWENLAGVAYASSRYEVAVQALNKALEREPTSRGVCTLLMAAGVCASSAVWPRTLLCWCPSPASRVRLASQSCAGS